MFEGAAVKRLPRHLKHDEFALVSKHCKLTRIAGEAEASWISDARIETNYIVDAAGIDIEQRALSAGDQHQRTTGNKASHWTRQIAFEFEQFAAAAPVHGRTVFEGDGQSLARVREGWA